MTTTPEPVPIPRLEAGGIVLRPHRDEDADEVYERSLDAVTQRFTSLPAEYTRDMAVEYVTRITAPARDQVSWAIELEGGMAGSIDLRTFGKGFDYGAGNLGFVTSPWARGRGVMTAAVALAVEHAFTLGLHTVVWDAHAGNIGSWKAVWRNGFHEFTYVPALLADPMGLQDAWHALLRADDPREPRGHWRDVIEESATPPSQRGF